MLDEVKRVVLLHDHAETPDLILPSLEAAGAGAGLRLQIDRFNCEEESNRRDALWTIDQSADIAWVFLSVWRVDEFYDTIRLRRRSLPITIVLEGYEVEERELSEAMRDPFSPLFRLAQDRMLTLYTPASIQSCARQITSVIAESQPVLPSCFAPEPDWEPFRKARRIAWVNSRAVNRLGKKINQGADLFMVTKPSGAGKTTRARAYSADCFRACKEAIATGDVPDYLVEQFKDTADEATFLVIRVSTDRPPKKGHSDNLHDDSLRPRTRFLYTYPWKGHEYGMLIDEFERCVLHELPMTRAILAYHPDVREREGWRRVMIAVRFPADVIIGDRVFPLDEYPEMKSRRGRVRNDTAAPFWTTRELGRRVASRDENLSLEKRLHIDQEYRRSDYLTGGPFKLYEPTYLLNEAGTAPEELVKEIRRWLSP